jgi:hypothetical protein
MWERIINLSKAVGSILNPPLAQSNQKETAE